MWLRLRQIALVATELDPVVDAFCDVLDVKVCYRDPGVAQFGLHNALMPIGNQFLEVVAPTEDGTAAGRYLQRRGGDGGYMVITQCDDHDPRRRRVAELGIRVAFSFEVPGLFRNLQMHPKDTGGTFFEIDQQLGEDGAAVDGPWHPAGPDWKRAAGPGRVAGIKAAEIQSDDPTALANRWADIAELPVQRLDDRDGASIAMENAEVRFVACTDGRPEGLGGIDLATSAAESILALAESRGVPIESGDGQRPPTVELGGMRIGLVDP